MTHSGRLLVSGAKIWTQDPRRPWAEAIAVADGRIVAVGDEAEARAALEEPFEVHDARGRLVLPALADGHAHLLLGGTQAAHELPLQPNDDVDTVLATVRAHAQTLPDGAWIVGGIIGTAVTDVVAADASWLPRLDEAAGGRPVMLRDDTMHNRWVSSAALALIGVDADTPDPEGGAYVRDGSGALTGVLYELACAGAEETAAAAVEDPVAYRRAALLEAQRIMHGFGVTSVHEAATMAPAWDAMAELDREGEWTLRVIGSAPTRQFLEPGTVGPELVEHLQGYRSELLRPDFVKVVTDGVPMTRTAALLEPYRCLHDHDDPDFRGDSYWSVEELIEQLEACHAAGLGAKCHATGDASLHIILEAAEAVRRAHPDEPRRIVQVAHAELVPDGDAPRFAELDVVADVSPFIWYPNVMMASMREQLGDERADRMWPLRTLLEAGALLSAGSDWPCALPSPDPWVGLETMITRADPLGYFEGVHAPEERLGLEQALAAFTVNPARAMGLDDVGVLAPGNRADFIVVDQDLFEVEPSRIHETQVLRTYAAGRVVFER